EEPVGWEGGGGLGGGGAGGGAGRGRTHYPKLRRWPSVVSPSSRDELEATRPARRPRAAVHTTAATSIATPSGTMDAGVRGRALELFRSQVGTSLVGNGMSSP